MLPENTSVDEPLSNEDLSKNIEKAMSNIVKSIVSLKEEMSQKIDDSEQKMSQKIDDSEQKMSQKIDESISEMNIKLEKAMSEQRARHYDMQNHQFSNNGISISGNATTSVAVGRSPGQHKNSYDMY